MGLWIGEQSRWCFALKNDWETAVMSKVLCYDIPSIQFDYHTSMNHLETILKYHLFIF